MNERERRTWERLRNVDLDAADAEMPFSARLARDNGWSTRFAAKAISEYRKFCFLVVHAGHPVTPSDEVDQVWHLHMLYSRHYWEALCRDALGMPLHHGPTAGGSAEDRKFRAWYDETLGAYRRYFGEPPAELWPASNERFNENNEFVRVNRRAVVLIHRAQLRRGVLASLAGGAVLAVAHALAQATGSEPAASSTSTLWLTLAVVAVVAIYLLVRRGGARGAAGPRRRRSDGAAVAPGGGSAPSTGSTDKGAADGGQSGCGSSDGSSGCGGGGN